jgi:Zn-dependent protease with chaperone function
MRARLIGAGRAALAAGLVLALAWPAAAGMRFGGGFSVSGKKGPFIRQVAGRDLGGSGAGASMGLNDGAAQGQFRAALLHMPQTEAAVADFISKLDQQWPYARTRPVKVFILGLDNYGAESMPDGSVVVPLGLIDQAQSDDELAFVLGHELGHIRLNHFARNAAQAQKKKDAGQFADIIIAGASVANAQGMGGETLNAALRNNAMNDAAHLFLQTLVAPDWSREEEDEADATGFDLSEGDAFAPDAAAAQVFDKLQADDDRRAALSDALAKGMQESMQSALNGSTVASIALSGGAGAGSTLKQGLISGAGKGLVSWMASGSQARHRPPDQRKKGIADYSSDAYPQGLPLRDEQHAWLDRVRATAEYRQAKVAVEAVRASVEARTRNQPDAALSEIDKALHTAFRDSALVSDEAARAWADKGDFARSEQYFTVADASPDQTVEGYRDHARMLIRASRYDRASQVAAAGTSRFGGDDRPFLPALIAISFNGTDHAQGLAYLRRCALGDDAALRNECSLAATSQSSHLTAEEKAEADQAVQQASNSGDRQQKGNPLKALGGLGKLRIPGT